jgi:hypothetical protein
VTDPLSIPCPAPGCGAEAGRPCVTTGRRIERQVPHSVREEAARRAARRPAGPKPEDPGQLDL